MMKEVKTDFSGKKMIEEIDEKGKKTKNYVSTKGIVHGDFAPRNIFFEEESQSVIVVDLESVADSVLKTGEGIGDIEKDIICFEEEIIVAFSRYPEETKMLKEAFLMGYLSGGGRRDHEIVREYFRALKKIDCYMKILNMVDNIDEKNSKKARKEKNKMIKK